MLKSLAGSLESVFRAMRVVRRVLWNTSEKLAIFRMHVWRMAMSLGERKPVGGAIMGWVVGGSRRRGIGEGGISRERTPWRDAAIFAKICSR